jgi:triosephosphate isomerase
MANTTWDDAIFNKVGDLITTVRAFVSGSDVTPITQYVSPNENGAYTTYIG